MKSRTIAIALLLCVSVTALPSENSIVPEGAPPEPTIVSPSPIKTPVEDLAPLRGKVAGLVKQANAMDDALKTKEMDPATKTKAPPRATKTPPATKTAHDELMAVDKVSKLVQTQGTRRRRREDPFSEMHGKQYALGGDCADYCSGGRANEFEIRMSCGNPTRDFKYVQQAGIAKDDEISTQKGCKSGHRRRGYNALSSKSSCSKAARQYENQVWNWKNKYTGSCKKQSAQMGNARMGVSQYRKPNHIDYTDYYKSVSDLGVEADGETKKKVLVGLIDGADYGADGIPYGCFFYDKGSDGNPGSSNIFVQQGLQEGFYWRDPPDECEDWPDCDAGEVDADAHYFRPVCQVNSGNP